MNSDTTTGAISDADMLKLILARGPSTGYVSLDVPGQDAGCGIRIDGDDVYVLAHRVHVLEKQLANLEHENKRLRGYGDDPSQGPTYISTFQHAETVAMYQRWATTGRFYR